MCVETHRTGLHITETINLRGQIPRFTLTIEHFPIYFLGNPIHMSWNHQNKAPFSDIIDLRVHMPRITLKTECFLICLLGNNINVCWNSQNRAHFYWDNQFGGSNAQVYSNNWTFSHLFPWKPHTCVLKSSEQGSILRDDWFEGSHAKVYSENWMFSHLSPWKHHKCVLKSSEQSSLLLRWSIWGVTCLDLL